MNVRQQIIDMIHEFGMDLYFKDTNELLIKYQKIVEFAVANSYMTDELNELLKLMESKDFIRMYEFMHQYFEVRDEG